ncbi:heterokaryon incompatibility protein-domain-containing protein [Xylariaceae sp. FL0255]|nr:heterokaryon incompatibility protein-domain-containing protein [Xylariaceae sp. FL0255]
MRLINTATLRLHEFLGDKVPEYAILSHTWEEGEVNFQEWTTFADALSTPRAIPSYRIRPSLRKIKGVPARPKLRINPIFKKPGFVKIKAACHRAQCHKIEWLWADTVCIDKTSSAELSEAINSMFTWYQDSEVCYVFLQDVLPDEDMSSSDVSEIFKQSRWFTRGWTLQELLAPRKLEFYDRNWGFINERQSLSGLIQDVTHISYGYLEGSVKLSAANVAEKMSWLSGRKTTRMEDIAYCALGLFNVNMPLLYGEGSKAFWRLQQEIVHTTHDQTIFYWEPHPDHPEWESMLAPCPEAFSMQHRCKNIQLQHGLQDHEIHYPYSMTHRGLSIQFPVIFSWAFPLGVLSAVQHELDTSFYNRACVPFTSNHLGLSVPETTLTAGRLIHLPKPLRKQRNNTFPDIKRYFGDPSLEKIIAPTKQSSNSYLAFLVLDPDAPLLNIDKHALPPSLVLFTSDRRETPLNLRVLYRDKEVEDGLAYLATESGIVRLFYLSKIQQYQVYVQVLHIASSPGAQRYILLIGVATGVSEPTKIAVQKLMEEEIALGVMRKEHVSDDETCGICIGDYVFPYTGHPPESRNLRAVYLAGGKTSFSSRWNSVRRRGAKPPEMDSSSSLTPWETLLHLRNQT